MVLRWAGALCAPVIAIAACSADAPRPALADVALHEIASVGVLEGAPAHLPLIADRKDTLVYSYENLPYPRVRVLRAQG